MKRERGEGERIIGTPTGLQEGMKRKKLSLRAKMKLHYGGGPQATTPKILKFLL